MKLSGKIRKIISLLNRTYGRPKALKRSDPVDEIVRTVLSQNTSDRNSLRAFAVLKKRFKNWTGLLRIEGRVIARLIKGAGLSNIKAERIKGILKEIKRREGRLDLSSLADLSLREALSYLISLKGVGPKTAACVMLFSFGAPAMPVDTHIFRVAKRLGLIAGDLNIEEAHEVISSLVPRNLIYEFHLGIIEHGRRVCKARNPKCGACVLYRLCSFEYKAFYPPSQKTTGVNPWMNATGCFGGCHT